MTQLEKRQASLIWWKLLPFEKKFYKIIQWLKSRGRDTTERHPDTIEAHEIQQIWEMENFKA